MPIKHLGSGGIIANYRCPAACGHCLYGCAPDAEPGYIDEQTADKLCKKLRKLGCRAVHIGGGEPFLNVDGLISLIKVTVGNGLQTDYIETNAAWITEDEDRNLRIIKKVVDAGGDCIMVSADPFHVEFIPFWKPATLIKLLNKSGIQHFIWQQRYITMLNQLDPYKKYNAEELRQVLGYDAAEQCALEYGMGFNGRALNLLRKSSKRKPVDAFLNKKSCVELLNTNHFHVDFLGRYVPPGCTGMGILTDDMEDELNPSNYPVISRLISGGLNKLFEYALNMGYTAAAEGYVSKCELCFDIRKYLAFNKKEAHPDLTPASFYKQDY